MAPSGPGGIRTPDLLSAIEARSQLRYRPNEATEIVPDSMRCVKQTDEYTLRQVPSTHTSISHTQPIRSCWQSLLLVGAQWTLASSPSASEESAFISVGQRPITTTSAYTAYLPLIQRNYPIVEEFRGLVGHPLRLDALRLHRDHFRSGHHCGQGGLGALQRPALSSARHRRRLLLFHAGTVGRAAHRIDHQNAGHRSRLRSVSVHDHSRTSKRSASSRLHQRLPDMVMRSLARPPDNTTPQHLFWTLSHATTWSNWRVYSNPESTHRTSPPAPITCGRPRRFP